MKFFTNLVQAWRGWQKRVATVGDLPTDGVLGEVRLVLADKTLYFWNGTAWEATAGGGGGSSNSFTTIQTDAGTSPVATSPNDTLTLTSSDSSVKITGDSSVDEIDIQADPDFIKSTAVVDSVSGSATDIAPSQNSVATALSSKADKSTTISSGSGLSGGGDLSTNRTLSVDIIGLTEDTTPDKANDFVMTYDASALGLKKVKLEKIGGSASLNGLFGSGVDGDVVISSNTSLTEDMYYNNLTVNATYKLDTNGYKVFVKNTTTSDGVISHNGNNANPATNGGGAGRTSGTIGVSYAGGAGGISGAGAAGANATNSLGGAGGAGGTGASGAGGAGGTVATPIAGNGGPKVWNNPFQASTGRVLNATQANFASGGGGGGSDGTTGAGAGGGGGCVILFSKKLAGTGSIEAKGGNGKNASGGNKGGGGGGGGGVVVIFSQTNITDTSLTVSVAGGIAGTGTGTGTDGTAGGAGTFINLTGAD